MLIIALILDLISMLVLLVSNSFTGGILSILILSLGLSLGSGNAQSILYESYDSINEVDSFKKINSNANSITLVCISLYSICSGFIFKMNMNYILYLDIVFIILHIMVTCIFLIDNKSNGSRRLEKKKKKASFNLSLITFKPVAKTLPVFISLALLFSFFRVTFNYYQPIYENFNIPVEIFGFFPLFYNGLAALGSQLYKKLIGEIRNERLQLYVIISILLFSITGIFIFRYNVIGVFLAIGIQQICRGADISLQPVMLNAVIPKNTNYRTMYISFFNMINTVIVFIFTMISSAILGFLDLFTALCIVSTTIILVLAIVNSIKGTSNDASLLQNKLCNK